SHLMCQPDEPNNIAEVIFVEDGAGASSPMRSALMKYDRSVRYNLPGENPAEFEQLHQELIAELSPSGSREEDTVVTTGLVWRTQNLGTLRIAQLARSRFEEISSDKFTPILVDRAYAERTAPS